MHSYLENDALGMCKVLASKKILAGNDVAPLDIPFEGTPYQNLAENIRDITDFDYKDADIRFLKKWTRTGFNWSWADDKWAFAAFYLLYVEWEVDETKGKCVDVKGTETISDLVSGDKQRFIGESAAKRAWTKARKKGQPAMCTTIVYVDAPGGDVITGRDGHNKPRKLHMKADARVYLTGSNYSTGPVDYKVEIHMKPNGESIRFHAE